MSAPADTRWDEPLRTVRIGPGALDDAPALLAELGFDPYALLTTPRAAAVSPALVAGARVVAHVAPGAVPEIAAAVRDAVRGLPLVALGGGRVIDAAKAIAQADGVAVAALPTTLAGSPLTRSGRPLPDGEGKPRVPPRLVIVEPALLASVPPPELAATALNSLAHAAESSYAPRATPVTQAASVRGALLLARGVEDGDVDALAVGGVLAGWALDATGFALHHVTCQSLVRTCGLPHARTNAIVLPHSLRAVHGRAPGALAPLADALAGGDVEAALLRITALTARTGATRLRELGMAEGRAAEVGRVAAGRPELAATPGPPATVATVADVIDAAW